ncbi:hypothetical protein GCM10009793_25330 [Brachybacterium phenoliresistens]
MVSRSKMTLEEIRDGMRRMKPTLEGFKGGWASVQDAGSNLRVAGEEPPNSDPEIVTATNLLPEMLQARFYYWDPAPALIRQNPDIDVSQVRKLNAIDVVVTSIGVSRIGILFSTRTRSYLGGKGGVIAALESILQTRDVTIKIDRHDSHLRLANEEIFLWLTVQHRDNPQIAGGIRLDQISGISSMDAASRTAELRFGVDFQRSNFLTAVAEKDTLGPMDIGFSHIERGVNHAYDLRLHIDGGIEISRNRLHVPNSLNDPRFMLNSVLLLTFYIIPQINRLYIADAANWRSKRADVIDNAMSSLETRYKELRAVLAKHKP